MQSYATNVYGEDVMIGNDVLLKCSIPSFLADFLSVSGWVGSEGAQISPNQNYNLGDFWPTRSKSALFLAVDCKEDLLRPVSTTKYNFVFEAVNEILTTIPFQ